MSLNNENEFRKEIISSLSSKIHHIKIPDEGKKLIKILPQHAEVIAKNIELKPYDLGLLYKGVYCALELKNIDDSLTFNMNKVETHQIKFLKESVKCGGLGYVLIRFKKGLSVRDKKRLNTTKFSVDRAFALDIKWISKQKEKSFPIEKIIEECIELPFDPYEKKYDLTVLWKTTK